MSQGITRKSDEAQSYQLKQSSMSIIASLSLWGRVLLINTAKSQVKVEFCSYTMNLMLLYCFSVNNNKCLNMTATTVVFVFSQDTTGPTKNETK